MRTCSLGHTYDDTVYPDCPYCDHLEADQHQTDINVGDDDHTDIVQITDTTTQSKGEPCII